ncbi:hypothetical protein Cdeb_02591 [Caldibacillus debilis GB1]|jgi:hypothetical protein|uniref:Uncharacterized protein n=1 Tax=Caldibacillus debilis GB1 TaxID=1339248 RepID=A0A420VJD8_9BACI|nr:hypothetical protein Cdeb_02591 [Caldibacillus debilis GB1]
MIRFANVSFAYKFFGRGLGAMESNQRHITYR